MPLRLAQIQTIELHFQALAKNVNVPPSILEKLAIENSSCLDIIQAVAENYQTPAIILELLDSYEDNRI